jgi:DNA polymerase III epsilon subunit-like protein
MAHDPLAGCRVVGFDLETTGLQKKNHRIVQFAIVPQFILNHW